MEFQRLFFTFRNLFELITCASVINCFSSYFDLQISQLNLTFKEILFKYRKQLLSKPQVFCSVFVGWSLACNGVCNQILTLSFSVNFSANNSLTKDLETENWSGPLWHHFILQWNIFILSVKPLLLELGPGGTKKCNQIPEINNNNYGKILFPKLLLSYTWLTLLYA